MLVYWRVVFRRVTYIFPLKYRAGDSIRDLLIPDRWRSPKSPWKKGHVKPPSQKGHGLNHQAAFVLHLSPPLLVFLNLRLAPLLTEGGWVPGGRKEIR